MDVLVIKPCCFGVCFRATGFWKLAHVIWFYLGSVIVVMSSWGNDMSVHMVAATRYTHQDSDIS